MSDVPQKWIPKKHRALLLPEPDNDDGALTIDLPLPPSVNRLQARLGNSSSIVQRWIGAADRHVLMDKRRIMKGAVGGLFTLHVTWAFDAKGWGDIDNRIKPLLDYLQRIGVIADDKHCRHLTVTYGEAPAGCRVRLSPWQPALPR